MSLMDMVKGAISKQVMGQIGGMLGTDEKKTSSVFENAAGSILGGLIKKSSTPDGARDVFDMAQKQDAGILDKLGDILGDKEAAADLQKSGGGVLEGVFGKQQSGMMETIAKALGIEGNVMSTLLKVLAPVIIGVVGRYVKSKALDAAGLGSFLGEQKKSLDFMPSSLTEGLGFGNLLGNASDAGKAAMGAASGAVGSAGNMGKAAMGSASDAAAQAGGGLAKLLIPIGLLAALAIGGWFLYPMLSGAGDAVKGAGEGLANMKAPQIPGMDLEGLEGFDMSSLGTAGPALAKGFGDITSGFEGLKDETGATDLASKITGFTGTIDGLGLDKLEGVAKTSATGLIGKFVETIKALLGGQSDGIKSILQPAIDGLMAKFKGFTGG
ncbi:MAG: DUF937 domain-containing protein [Mariniblastus sp.]